MSTPSTPRMGPETALFDKKSSLLKTLFSDANIMPEKPTFEEWSASVSKEQILTLLTNRFTERAEPMVKSESLSDEEITYFDTTVSTLIGIPATKLTPDTEVPVSKVITHLTTSWPESSNPISSATPLLESLLVASASYPFTATRSPTLTHPSLLRAVVLLTSRAERAFGPNTTTKAEPSFTTEEYDSKRLDFICSALSNELPRRASEAEVLQALSRVHYPKRFNRKAESYRSAPVEQLQPVAKRLFDEAGKDVPVWSSNDAELGSEQLKPLAELLASLNGPGMAPHAAQMSAAEFQSWAKENKLLFALDKLFSCFYESRQTREAREDSYRRLTGNEPHA